MPKLIATIVLSAIAFALANAYVACLIVIPGQPISNLMSALQEFPTYVLAHGPLSRNPAALASGTVAACGVWIAWAYSLMREGNYRTGEEHGSARWGTIREGRRFADTRHPFNNILLTRHFGMVVKREAHSRKYERNRNVLVLGGSGAGKTRGFVEPNIMQMNGNYLVTDPKGTTLRNVGHMLVEGGYDLKVFDTVDFSNSMHYNPIAYLRTETDILEFTECFIANTTGDKEHSGDPFWEKAERLLYVALIGYLVFHCPKADRSLSGVLTLLSLAKAKETDEEFKSPLDLLFEEIRTGKRYVRSSDGAVEVYDAESKKPDTGGASAFKWATVREPVAYDEDFSLLHYKMFKDAAGVVCSKRLLNQVVGKSLRTHNLKS